jgi:hypothetical protein
MSQKELNNFLINVSYVSNKNESYFIYFAVSPSTLTRFVLEYTGELNLYVWDEYLRKWNLVWMTPLQHCEILGFCGDLGICNQQKLPLCDCPKGFKPRYPTDWDLYDYSGGCENNSITWRAHSIGALEKAALMDWSSLRAHVPHWNCIGHYMEETFRCWCTQGSRIFFDSVQV